ncbi:PfkB family carbohydrate kinase [Streptomyces sp. NPDC048415]|uniref:PfkB family carbohydrate kinase n=1 Tax=Streptomyces sp. NPDC048415 TaxID=3154822 RepID=UPI0034214E5F
MSFDVSHRPALWPDVSAATVSRDLADRADIVFVGLDEAQRLWGQDLKAADVRELLGCPRVLVVKDNAYAASAFSDEGVCTVPALRTTVVEPVGAGDAFAAGFLAGPLRGLDVVRALRLGHITAISALWVTGEPRAAAGCRTHRRASRHPGPGVARAHVGDGWLLKSVTCQRPFREEGLTVRSPYWFSG